MINIKIKLSTLTPIHIGNGEDYGYGEAYVEKNLLHRCDIDYSKNKHIINELIKNIRNVQYVQRILREYGKERYTAKSRCNINFRDNSVVVMEHIKENNMAYIPGSSIKGALRSALYGYYLYKNGFKIETPAGTLDFLSIMKNGNKALKIKYLLADKREDLQQNKHKLKNGFGKRFEDLVFSYSSDLNNWRNAKYDILKFLLISDFYPKNYKLYVDLIKTYSKTKNGSYPKSYKIYAETVEGDFEGDIKISQSIVDVLKNERLLKKKLDLLGLASVDLGDIDKATEVFIHHLQKATSYFYEQSMKYDKEKLNLEHPQNVIKADFKIRLGIDVGTHYQTILKILENRDVYIAKKILQYLSKNSSMPYPKSYEVVEYAKIPLGWMEVVT